MNQEQPEANTVPEQPQPINPYKPQYGDNVSDENTGAQDASPSPLVSEPSLDQNNQSFSQNTPFETTDQPPVESVVDQTQTAEGDVSQAPQPVAFSETEPASAGTGPQPFVGASTTTQPVFATAPAGKNGGKKKFIIAGVIAFIVVGLMGGGAYAYTAYQKPDNALLDAVGKALSAKQVNAKTTVTSDFVYTAGDTKLKLEKLTFNMGAERTPKFDENAELALSYNGKSVTLKASVLATDKGEVYFRVSNLKDTIQKTIGSDSKMTAKAEEYLAKIDGKWAKYTLADLKKDNPDSGKTVQCTLDTYKKYKDDKKAIQELVDLYKKNQFAIVKGDPITKDGNIGYVVDIDKTKAKAFEKASSNTAMAKELDTCDGSKSATASDEFVTQDGTDSESADSPKTVTTIWVSQWWHTLRSVETVTSNMSGMDDKKFTVATRTVFDFTKGVTTSVPTDAMKMKDWTDNATNFYGEMNGIDMVDVEARAGDTTARSYASMVAMKAEAYNVIKSAYPASIADFETVSDSQLKELYPSLVVATLPGDQEHVAYKKCTTDAGAQIVYKKSDGTFLANNVGRTGGSDQIVTALCK